MQEVVGSIPIISTIFQSFRIRNRKTSSTLVKEYFSVIEDTLMGFVLEPWVESKKRKAIQTAKFYLFDTGVANYLLGITNLQRESSQWGKNFEQFIAMELRAYLSYRQQKLYFWRSENKQEVDFLLGDEVAIEVKSTHRVSRKHFGGLKALMEEKIFKSFYLVSSDEVERVEESISILHWQEFLRLLWNDQILS